MNPSVDHLILQSSDPALVLDPAEDRFVAANTAGCAMLGRTLEELLVTSISRIHPGELPQLQEIVGRVLASGHGSTITLTCRTARGAYLPTEMSLHAFESDGRVHLLALVLDRSEHRHATR